MTSRKDFQRAANLVGQIRDDMTRATAATCFIAFFSNDNPRFDAQRFVDWVGEVHAEHKLTRPKVAEQAEAEWAKRE